jgi:hypothetical protein
LSLCRKGFSPRRDDAETDVRGRGDRQADPAGSKQRLEKPPTIAYSPWIMDAVDIQSLYDTDELAWIEAQVDALRSGDLDRLDRANLIECLTDMAKRERRELKSRLRVLAMHVLKCRIQPPATRSWWLTIQEQKRMIRDFLRDYPSLAAQADDILRDAYPDAIESALDETGLDRAVIPSGVPTVQDLLTFDASL